MRCKRERKKERQKKIRIGIIMKWEEQEERGSEVETRKGAELETDT